MGTATSDGSMVEALQEHPMHHAAASSCGEVMACLVRAAW